MDITSVCAAFGLSAAAGLNAWLPLFAAGLLDRLDVVELAQPFDDLTGTGALTALGALTAADFVGDKIPAVDHVLHAIGTVVAPVSGGLLFTGQSGVDRRDEDPPQPDPPEGSRRVPRPAFKLLCMDTLWLPRWLYPVLAVVGTVGLAIGLLVLRSLDAV